MSDQGQELMDVWSKVIPKLAITIQLTLDSALTLAFASSGTNFNDTNATNTNQGEFTCHGNSEVVWRTTLFGITLLIGWFFMKHFDTDVLFHEVMNLFLVSGWLFSVSNYPITCWIQQNGVLTMGQSRNITLLRLFVTTIINNVWVVLETNKPRWLLMLFRQLSRLLLMCSRPLLLLLNQFDRLINLTEGNSNDPPAQGTGNTNTNTTNSNTTGSPNTTIQPGAPNTQVNNTPVNSNTPVNNDTQGGNDTQGSTSVQNV
jgi:hypothetical protein